MVGSPAERPTYTFGVVSGINLRMPPLTKRSYRIISEFFIKSQHFTVISDGSPGPAPQMYTLPFFFIFYSIHLEIYPNLQITLKLHSLLENLQQDYPPVLVYHNHQFFLLKYVPNHHKKI